MPIHTQIVVDCDRCSRRLVDKDGFDHWITEDAAEEAAEAESWEHTAELEWLCPECHQQINANGLHVSPGVA